MKKCIIYLKVFTSGGESLNIYDIAEKAQVSIATVSRVINNSGKVSEKTRRRVKEVMREEKYVPNAFARGLGLNSMKMVGVMCTDITDPFYARAVGAIESLLRSNGMDTVLCCTGNELSDKKRSLKALVDRKVDAVILIGSAFREKNDNSHICAAAERLPVIIINGYISAPGVYCVLCDERRAIRRTVSALYRQGCRNIAYIYDADTYSGREKRSGYAEGCRENGINECCLLSERSTDGAYKTVKQLFSVGEPDAVIAAEDLLAAGALRALEEMGKAIPVVGFNNSVIAECTSPQLTSVDNLCESMCETAVRLISDIAAGKAAPQKTVLSARLVKRKSFIIDKW